MELPRTLGISRLVPQVQRLFFGVLPHIINPLLTKLVRSRWLDIGLVFFVVVVLRFMNLDFVSHRKHATKTGTWPIPSTL